MKIITSLSLLIVITSCAGAKEMNYTGSTPAGSVVRSFLGIPLSDSIDFIRWKLMIRDNAYSLECNYGIGKPNTNGFMNGGKKVKIAGTLKKEKNFYYFSNENKVLQVVGVNANLLHILNNDHSLLVGNGGWSYMLNRETPVSTKEVSLTPQKTVLKDSMAFHGRTPCAGLAEPRTGCYKLKWYIVLYADAKTNQPAGFFMNGTAYYQDGGKKGEWDIVGGQDGRIIYQLNTGDNRKPLYLQKLDENILIFTDEKGNLLVGDPDFSYTLNRRG